MRLRYFRVRSPCLHDRHATDQSAGLSAQNQKALRDAQENRELLKPRANPKLTREETCAHFRELLTATTAPFVKW
jgi:hypothetical protein